MLAGRCSRIPSTHFLSRNASHWDKISKLIGPIPVSPPAPNFGRDFDVESTIRDPPLDKSLRRSEQSSPLQPVASDQEDGYKHLSDLLQQLEATKKIIKTLKKKKLVSKHVQVTGDTIQALQAAGIDIMKSGTSILQESQVPSIHTKKKRRKVISVSDSKSKQKPKDNEKRKTRRRESKVSTAAINGQIESMPVKPTRNADYSRKVEGDLSPAESAVLEDISLEMEQPAVARLAHGLERVLFNPGVHWFQDPHSRVFNFPHKLQRVPSVADFAFDRVVGFITSSNDKRLATLAKLHNKRFTGSTSSLSGILSHIYYLISGFKKPDISTLTPPFHALPLGFSGGTKIPTSVAFRRTEEFPDLYALDSVKSKDEEGKNVLTYLGTMLENYLTMSEANFAYLLKCNPPPLTGQREDSETYRYSKSSKFVMRSQLDCQDNRLPGSGVFDLKTRACIAIRLDMLNWEENAGYQINQATGLFESFEREYFDLIRSAFLKYQFQVRIGGMDGVFVAYHNTAKFFGFQYIPLKEMDERLFGSAGSGELVFQKCVGLLEVLADEIVNCYPGQSVRCLVETRESDNVMGVWVQPEDEQGRVAEEVNQKQNGRISYIWVTVSNIIDGTRVSSAEAVSSGSDKWTVDYTISHSSQSQAQLQKSYRAALERRNMAMFLPTGVSASEYTQTWQRIHYGDSGSQPTTQDEESENSVANNANPRRKFVPPHHFIKMLRTMARKGRGTLSDDNADQAAVWSTVADSRDTTLPEATRVDDLQQKEANVNYLTASPITTQYVDHNEDVSHMDGASINAGSHTSTSSTFESIEASTSSVSSHLVATDAEGQLVDEKGQT